MKLEHVLSREHNRYQSIPIPSSSLRSIRSEVLTYVGAHPHKFSKSYVPKLIFAWVGMTVLVMMIGFILSLRSHLGEAPYVVKRMYEEVRVATALQKQEKLALRREMVAARIGDLTQVMQTDDIEVFQEAFDETKQAVYTLLAQVPQENIQTEIYEIIAMLDATARTVSLDSSMYQQIQQFKTELAQYPLEENVQAASVAPNTEPTIISVPYVQHLSETSPQPTVMVRPISSATPSSTENHEGSKDKEKNKDKGQGSENKSETAQENSKK